MEDKMFFCNGKNEYCEDNEKCSDDCKYYNGKGGHYIQKNQTHYPQIDPEKIMRGDDAIARAIEEFYVVRNRTMDSAILGEIRKIITDHGVETTAYLNEQAIVDALRKHTEKKYVWQGGEYQECPSCGEDIHVAASLGREIFFCSCCGQKYRLER